VKRRVLLLGAALVILSATFAWAQNQTVATQSKEDYFVKTVYLNKVYPTKFGYIVAYVDSAQQYAQAYLPITWFNDANGKGQLLFGVSKSEPYMNIFWLNGKFDHVQLFVDPSYNDPSWGVLPETPGLSAKFNQSTLEMKF